MEKKNKVCKKYNGKTISMPHGAKKGKGVEPAITSAKNVENAPKIIQKRNLCLLSGRIPIPSLIIALHSPTSILILSTLSKLPITLTEIVMLSSRAFGLLLLEGSGILHGNNERGTRKNLAGQ